MVVGHRIVQPMVQEVQPHQVRDMQAVMDTAVLVVLIIQVVEVGQVD